VADLSVSRRICFAGSAANTSQDTRRLDAVQFFSARLTPVAASSKAVIRESWRSGREAELTYVCSWSRTSTSRTFSRSCTTPTRWRRCSRCSLSLVGRRLFVKGRLLFGRTCVERHRHVWSRTLTTLLVLVSSLVIDRRVQKKWPTVAVFRWFANIFTSTSSAVVCTAVLLRLERFALSRSVNGNINVKVLWLSHLHCFHLERLPPVIRLLLRSPTTFNASFQRWRSARWRASVSPCSKSSSSCTGRKIPAPRCDWTAMRFRKTFASRSSVRLCSTGCWNWSIFCKSTSSFAT